MALVPAYSQCTSPNTVHGLPLNSQSCTPPVPGSTFLTTGSPDANGLSTRMTASLRLIARLGVTSTPADEADVRIVVNATDVRRRSDLTDYTGQLEGRLSLRITDRVNGATGRDSATVTSAPFDFPVPCAATGGTTNVGSTCSLDSTADAIMPGAVLEDRRTIWQVDEVRLFDGGADGQAGTQDNTLFLRQGVFVP